MADEAVLGFGAKFHLHDGTSLVELDGILAVNSPQLTIETVDTTHHGSSGGVRTHMPGLGDAGNLQVRMFYSPGSTTDTKIRAQLTAMAAKTALSRAFKIEVKETDGTYQSLTGDCVPVSYEIDDIGIDDKMTATFTAKITGAVTQAAV